MKYGSRLREIIKGSSFNQVELAEKIGVSKSTISFWINSEFPPLEGIESICNALEIPVYRFFMGEQEIKDFMGLDPEWLEIGKVIQPFPVEVKNLFYDQILAAMKTLKAALLKSK